MFEVCKRCGMPNTRPGSIFTGGVCQACVNYENRDSVRWDLREEELKDICADIKKMNLPYDCVCPVSGGKDSTTIVAGLTAMGMKPLLVTVTDEFTHTKAGLHNVKNIAERFNLDHMIFRHEPKTFKQETFKSFKNTLHPLEWIEEKIYETPIKIAKSYGIPFVFFGENSAWEYGTSDTLETRHPLSDIDTTVYYYFAFKPYDEEISRETAREYGFRDLDYFNEWPRQGQVENYTQIDSIAYIIQLWTKFPKYGFQRVSDITSRMVRKGKMQKYVADQLVRDRDWICDPSAKRDFCQTIGITEMAFDETVDKHANHDILIVDSCGNWRRRDLI